MLLEARDRARRLLRAWSELGRDAAVDVARDSRSSRNWCVNLGWFFVIFGAFVIVGAGNAVNLTDGLDGLAIVPVMIAAASFGLIAYLAGNAVFSDYLQIHYVAGTGELAVLCGAVLGAGLGFLWFNAPPASIFMGDTGSLALGGMLGSIAVAIKHEIVLAVIGGLFVLEAVSVIVQVVSFKLTGKRVFRMAPIHHHFEQLGWTEPQIVIRFWIISVCWRSLGLVDAEAAVIAHDPRHHPSPARRSRCSGSAARALRAASALLAGGADVIACDDNAENVAKAAQAGFTTADLRTASTGANFAALVLTPGVPLTHPAPHWTRAAGARGRRRGDRRHRTVLPRAPPHTRRTRRSSPSPAPTANRPRRR